LKILGKLSQLKGSNESYIMKNFDEYFMEMAELVSTKSKDHSTKVGCVLVGPNNEVRSTGYNGFCRGVDDNIEERYQKPEKLFWTEHAERNAIFNAARHGTALEGCTAYIKAPIPPCADCTRAFIQSGIKKIVIEPSKHENGMWINHFKRSVIMLQESGVELVFFDKTENPS